MQEAGENEREVLVEDDGVEVEEGSTVEGDLEVAQDQVGVSHATTDALFCQEVHSDQIDQEDGEGNADVVDVAEEVDVSVVVEEVGRRGVVQLNG